jgi:hypothetical protein
MTLRRCYIPGPLLLVALVMGCDRTDPLQPAIQAATAAGSGATLSPPSGINAVAVSESDIDVSWQDNSTGETGFEVYRSISGPSGTFTLRASTGAGVTGSGDLGLTPSTQYCYKVRAFKIAGRKTSYSAFSGTACATTPAPPPPPGPPSAPSAVNAALVLDQSIAVSWADNSSNEEGFRVERSTDGGTSWVTTGTSAVDNTDLVDYAFPTEQQVCYRVLAFNGMDDSPPSNTACTARPAAPDPLSATVVDPETIDLTWADNSSFEDGYGVWGTLCYDFFGPIAVLPANATSLRLTTEDLEALLGPGSGWVFYVRALKDVQGYSGPSNQLVVDPLGQCP